MGSVKSYYSGPLNVGGERILVKVSTFQDMPEKEQ